MGEIIIVKEKPRWRENIQGCNKTEFLWGCADNETKQRQSALDRSRCDYRACAGAHQEGPVLVSLPYVGWKPSQAISPKSSGIAPGRSRAGRESRQLLSAFRLLLEIPLGSSSCPFAPITSSSAPVPTLYRVQHSTVITEWLLCPRRRSKSWLQTPKTNIWLQLSPNALAPSTRTMPSLKKKGENISLLGLPKTRCIWDGLNQKAYTISRVHIKSLCDYQKCRILFSFERIGEW